ncbi:MAG: glutamate racemase [Solirubrobacteraceae bacterium]
MNTKNNNAPLGIFDSGVGGLTVVKEINKILPNENLIYFGDTKHVPYGDKSKETIIYYSKQITEFLIKENCKAIVIACNTATANAHKDIVELAKKFKIPVFDVITPVAEKVGLELNQKIGVIATKGTINSGIYKKKIKKFNKSIEVLELATSLLVPIIEEGLVNSDISKETIKYYLANKKLSNIDALILGCTHYPLISKEINKYFNGNVKIIDSPLIVANQIQYYFKKNNLLSDNTNKGDLKFYLSDYTNNFEKLAKKFFGNEIYLTEIKL